MGTRFCIWLIVILVVVNVVESFRRVSFPGQDTGRTCRTKAGQRGRCETFLRCPAAIADIRKGIYPTICSFGSGGIRDIRVCCVESGGPTPTKDAFAKFSDVCGKVSVVKTGKPNPILWAKREGPPTLSDVMIQDEKINPSKNLRQHSIASVVGPRTPIKDKFPILPPLDIAVVTSPPPIETFLELLEREQQLSLKPLEVTYRPTVVGGEDAERNAWPWMTLLGRRRGSQIEWFCGGVLITDQHILTAAHCFSTISKPDVVRLGEHDLSQTTESPHIDVSASTVYRHRSFSSPAVHDDIAIVKLTRPVEFSSYVRPICMPASDFTPSSVGVRGTITGWGTTSFGGRSSDILQQVSVPIVGTGTCDAAYKRSPVYRRSFPQGFPKNLFCASEEQGGKDACQGDSGGPYMVVDGGRYRVTGIVSSGLGCGSKTYPGLYTWVYPYLQWMQETVAK